MKQILITGSSRGLGLACAKEFESDHEVISLSRGDDATETGDLTDRKFLQHIVGKYNPDVLINNAGVWTDDWQKQMDVNFFQAGFLATKFYKKMKPGSHIVNVCSMSSTAAGWPNMSDADMYYIMAKTAMKTLSNTLSRSKKRPIKVTSLEPAFFLTDFANIKQNWDRIKDNVPATHFWYKQKLMTPDYIASVIRWVLSQPSHVEVSSLQLSNCLIEERS